MLDVDTGTDDALAILYAVRHPDLEVLAISCVAGNSGLDQVVINTAKVLDAAEAPDIPIAAGARQPLIERVRPEGAFHGIDGLGGIELPPSDRRLSNSSAVELLHRTIMQSQEPVTLVALAPQTNVAMLLTLHPEVTENLERIVFMGGSASAGNITAVDEFNVWQDPEAATCVIESPVPPRCTGWTCSPGCPSIATRPTASRHRRTARTGWPVSCSIGAAPGPTGWVTTDCRVDR